MRILITGGHGQLGQALETAFLGEEVWAPGHAELDVTNRQQVHGAIARWGPDTVIHAAAWTDTAGCEKDPARAMRDNGQASGFVAEACRQSEASMVYVSSNEVFDGDKRIPYLEGDAPNPINVYGRSKLEGESRVRAALDRYCIVRTSWLYGPGRISFPEKILAAAREKGALKLVTDEVASPTWTRDLAKAVSGLVRLDAVGVFHLTNAGSCSRKEWAEEVLRLAGESVPVEASTQAEFGAAFRKPPFSSLANVKAERLGITMRPWQEALTEHIVSARRSKEAVR
jgi:dTDP-4-dehydrorhamnose reductase